MVAERDHVIVDRADDLRVEERAGREVVGEDRAGEEVVARRNGQNVAAGGDTVVADRVDSGDEARGAGIGLSADAQRQQLRFAVVVVENRQRCGKRRRAGLRQQRERRGGDGEGLRKILVLFIS
ncbi:hypothetical protein E6W36_02680 [Hankyongella ginsenosidimutans]|uniref:Uncharacterized protein n=1 Tax=Hankyongella ginsenosidimutans TaxID=1763828 RepID=A0A4D7CBP2_9SPHN|nr:hypothetical protein [Hankyongella ginsenosidimutans]QCI78902.1 hypothetical protein E6W36_02680 [Hankyongella ginsenosidimutans]